MRTMVEIEEIPAKKPRVFLSHSSGDEQFTKRLACDLRSFGMDVWYDQWEIAVGDSIVEKVFAGLHDSDTLVVVLSPAAVVSRWVKEELNSAVMRRLSENNIRILPVVIGDCTIPVPLRHIKYADFRADYDSALAEVLESLAPGHHLWQSLSHLYDHFCTVCDHVVSVELDQAASEDILKIQSLLECALNLRTEIEFRRSRTQVKDMDFFDKIGFLAQRGIDVRSQTWNAVVTFRSQCVHEMGTYQFLWEFRLFSGKRTGALARTPQDLTL